MRLIAYLGILMACVTARSLRAAEILFDPFSPLGSGASLETLASGPQTVRLKLRVGGLTWHDAAGGFQTVSVKGLTPMGRIGAPDLPATGVLLAIPDGNEPVLKIVSEQTRIVEAKAVQPCQPRARCSAPRFDFQMNRAIYDATTPYPAVSVRLEPLGRAQSQKFARVAFYPVRMQAGGRTLAVTSEMEVEVKFRGRSRAAALENPWRQTVAKLAANAAELGGELNPNNGPASLVVIAADALWDALLPFMEWKRQRGLRVDAYRFSEVGGSREAAKRFLQAYYDRSQRKPSFLLLAGNKDSLPGFFEPTSFGQAATDLPYALLEGNDGLPDVFFGRLIADNAAEADTQVKRWIAYEKEATGEWLTNAVTIASSEGFRPSDEDYADMIGQNLRQNTYRHVDKLFERLKSARAVDIWNALRDGRGWLAYFGHGLGTEWLSTNLPFTLSDIDKVQNAGQLPWIVDVACQNADWVGLPTCFGKKWVTLERGGTPNGAVAYYGGSVKISWHEPAVMSVGVAKYHFERGVQTVGASVFAGQMYLLEKMGMAPNTLENLRWYNLFGDPSLLLRTDTPKPYQVAHQLLNGTHQIKAVNAFGDPMPGVVASFYVDGESAPRAVGMTDTSGLALLNAGAPLPVGTLLTTSGYNLETYQTSL